MPPSDGMREDVAEIKRAVSQIQQSQNEFKDRLVKVEASVMLQESRLMNELQATRHRLELQAKDAQIESIKQLDESERENAGISMKVALLWLILTTASGAAVTFLIMRAFGGGK